MKSTFFTCPKMALLLTFRLLITLAFIVLSFFVFWDMIFVAIIASAFFVFAFIVLILINEKLSLSFRSFILVKISKEGVANTFCKIKWDEITKIEYENLEFESSRSIMKKLGMVLIIYKNDNTIKEFKAYSLKEAICIPLN